MKFHYITPHSSEAPPNIGKAINEAVNGLNASPDDWIIHTDQDACFLLPKDRNKLEAALINCNYDIVGTLTNRLNPDLCGSQVVKSLYNEFDIGKHIEYAKTAKSGFIEADIIALMCMAFKKSFFDSVGGFIENSPYLDQDFSKKGKCAVYTGVYVFHVYRMFGDDKNHSHLIR